MRQVPNFRYLIIGDGKVASHFSAYFQQLDLSFSQWSRKNADIKQLRDGISSCSHILILINDREIENFIRSQRFSNQTLIHFSGSLSTPLAHGAHPLMTFGPTPYSLARYQSIPFILEAQGPAFNNLLPGLANPYYYIPKERKAYYHALCVMSANFSAILWNKLFDELTHTFHLPNDVAHPYLEQAFENIKNNPHSALTGPLIRNDQSTLQANLRSLKNDPFYAIYLEFCHIYQRRHHECS